MNEALRFQMVRGVDRRIPSTAEALVLFPQPVERGELFTAGPTSSKVAGGFEEFDTYPDQAVIDAARAWREDPNLCIQPDRAGTPARHDRPEEPQEFAEVVDVLRALDEWLATGANTASVAGVSAEGARLARELADIDTEGSPQVILRELVQDTRWDVAWDRLRKSLCAVLASDGADAELDSRLAGRLQRLLLVGGLVLALVDEATAPRSPEALRRMLRDRVVVVPSPPFPLVEVEQVAPRQRVQLVRRAGFADLWVVREEWACYLPGEIAHIENVLSGELRRRVHKRVDETEVTETKESETTRSNERDTETTERFQLSEEASRDTSLAIHVDGQVDTSGQYGATNLQTHVGGSLDWSVQESRSRAREVASESVERFVRKVQERVRTERVERTLTRIVETNTHEIDNTVDPQGHVVGVYRWVDKVQRMQMFRYPNRYLLEFEIPEPASLVRWLQDRGPGQTPATPPPPPFSKDGKPLSADGSNQLTMSTFSTDDYGVYAARYGADVPAPPDEWIWVTGSKSFNVEEGEAHKATVPTLGAPPTVAETLTLTVPDGYGAHSACASAAGAPVHAEWQDHPAPWVTGAQSDGWDTRDGYHVIRAEITLAGTTIRLPVAGSHPTVIPSIDEPLTQYWDAFFAEASPQVTLAAAAEQDVTVGVTMSGTYHGSVSVALRCLRLRSTAEQWRLETYAALHDAHRAWQERYDNEMRGLKAVQEMGVMAGSSPARNREVIREELKRQIIEMLLGSTFDGFTAVVRLPGAPVRPRVDLAAAMASASTIQFLEQVFEWDKLTYVLYPYYWAAGSEWAALQPLDGADPEFTRFLRSGSARVVVSARPGFANAVNHWLWFGQPWGGGPAAAPGQDGYISVADEIRSLTQAPDEGEPAESWEVRLPTSLLWLDPDATLPKHNEGLRLDEPATAAARLCRPCEDSRGSG